MEKLSLNDIKKMYRTSIIQDFPLPINQKLLDYLDSKKHNSYFEFGCNWGLNLKCLREEQGNVFVFGLDLSILAIKKSMIEGIPVMYGDERLLAHFPNKMVDCVFTVSCLNHIPEEAIQEIMFNLTRIAKREIILVESNEGKNDNWYAHDYISYGFEPFDEIDSNGVKFIYYRLIKPL